VATDLLARIRGELEERMEQLRPLLSEYERLIAAAATLTAMSADAPLPHGAPVEGAPTAPMLAEAIPSAPARRRRRPLRGTAAGAVARVASTPAPSSARAGGASTPRASSTPAAAEIGQSPVPAPPAAGIAQPAPPPEAASAEPLPSIPLAEDRDIARPPASPAAVQQAILAALEHGSHTASELVMVTAMSASEIRGGLGRLTRRGGVAKVKRHGDGKTAYALR
jgi:hypothetical protein